MSYIPEKWLELISLHQRKDWSNYHNFHNQAIYSSQLVWAKCTKNQYKESYLHVTAWKANGVKFKSINYLRIFQKQNSILFIFQESVFQKVFTAFLTNMFDIFAIKMME